MSAMDYGVITFWMNVAVLVVNTGIGIFVWINRRHQVTEDQVSAIAGRVTHLESEVNHLPTHQDIRALIETIGGLRGDLSEVSGRLSGVNRAVDLINTHLLNRS